MEPAKYILMHRNDEAAVVEFNLEDGYMLDVLEKKNNSKRNVPSIRSSAAEYLTYIAAVGDSPDSIEMRYQDENIWLTQKLMAELYDVTVQNIGQHIKKIFEDGELIPDSVIKKFFTTATDGKDYITKHYNLQMIISVGFKVNNERAVRFRKWAGQIVKDFELLCSLGVLNAPLMNDAVYKFKRYEDSSLNYTGIGRHKGEAVGGYDTVLTRDEFEELFGLQQGSLRVGNYQTQSF